MSRRAPWIPKPAGTCCAFVQELNREGKYIVLITHDIFHCPNRPPASSACRTAAFVYDGPSGAKGALVPPAGEEASAP
jgi:hypothetical protein